MKLPTKIITEIISLKVDLDVNTGHIEYNLRINNDYTSEDIGKLLTKEICKRSDKSRELRQQSDILMDIRSLIKQ